MFETDRRISRRIAAAGIAVLATLGVPASVASAASPLHHTGDLAASTQAASTLLEACPIEGDHDLHDSWGWPRSGGRRHQGIDVAAPHGTELYAVRDGVADFKRTNLGGNSVWLVTDDGDRFFYAHLDGFVGDDREVEAGELIGFVGSTGNAGGPHLHFETHPSGNVENPFRHVVDACPPEPDAAALALDALLDRIQRDPSGWTTRPSATEVRPI